MFVRNLSFIAVFAVLLSCSGAKEPIAENDFEIVDTDNKAKTDNITEEENCDTVSLKYKLDEHAFCLKLNNTEMNEANISASNINQLKKWWDSLPQPLQDQIKAQEVEIELVSNVISNGNTELTPEITDSRIENTGAALEKIIGESTEMTYTVKTKQMDTDASSSASTNIVPYIIISTKLAQFSTSLAIDKNGISAQNVHSLQYWWSSLPDDLKIMIQNNEVALEVNCIAIDKGIEFRKNARLGDKSDNYLFLLNQYLQNMIGFKKISNKNLPLGTLKNNSQIEKVIGNQSADYIIRINLKNQKVVADKPSV